jgi:hypothetical protein
MPQTVAKPETYLLPLALRTDTLPSEINRWRREHSQMKLVQENGRWTIEGPGKKRARIAYASSDGQHLVYTLE